MNHKILKFVLYGNNPPSGYSGGRYHSWLMANALASAGHSVTYLTNNIPSFIDDFKYMGAENNLKIKLFKNLNLQYLASEIIDIDWIVIIPDYSSGWHFYSNAFLLSQHTNSKLCLLNFETPNWVNKISNIQRNPDDWYYWKEIAKYSSIVLSSTKESNSYAKKFYSQSEGLVFKYCYPSINTETHINRKLIRRDKKRILWIGRMTNSRHKGSYDLHSILSKQMQGYTLVLIIGHGEIPEVLKLNLNKRADKYGIKLIIKRNLTDHKKFIELCKASLLLFPSQFEGFGIPPIESLFCQTPCIAFDLPVLRETCKNDLIYARRGDFNDFRNKIVEFLKNPKVLNSLPKHIEEIALYSNFKRRISDVFTNYL